jgi:hypothetical protein
MLRTFLARSCQPQRIITRAVTPSAPSGIRFIATTSQPATHPEGKDCYLERLTGEDQGRTVLLSAHLRSFYFPTVGKSWA